MMNDNAPVRLRAVRKGALALFLACAAVWLLPAVVPGRAAADEGATRKVTLTIDFGNGFQKQYTRLAWKEGMTIEDAMRLAQHHESPTKFTWSGSGSTAFLTQVDDMANEGGGGRNWIFHVNGRLGDVSFGAMKLDAGDEVLWRFGDYR